MWKINLAQSSEQPLRILFCPPDLWTSAVSLCDPSSSGRWTGGGYWWAWRALSTPYSPAADQKERERERERAGGVEGRQKRSENRREVTEPESTKPESPVSESERALPAVIVSTGGYVPSWLQQAWQSDWFRSNIMASYECWVWLRGTIRATMADKSLSTPQRSEGPFHACPGAGRAAESWWPAGSLAPLQPNAISTLRPLWAAGRMGTQGCRVCVTQVGI